MDPLRLGQSVARVARSRLTRRAALASSGAGLASALLDRLGVTRGGALLAQDATPARRPPGRQPAAGRPGLDADPGAPASAYGERAPPRRAVVRWSTRAGRQLLAAGRSARHPHAQRPLLRGPLRRHPRHRPGRAPAAGPRPGRAADALHHGRPEALPLRLASIHFLECSGNSFSEWTEALDGRRRSSRPHGLTSCAEWTGVPVATVLREVGIKPGGGWMLAEGADAAGHDRSIPVAKAMADGLLAYAANGEELRPSQGYPVRLLLPGFEGNTNVKWLRRLKVGTEPWHTRQETSHYTDLMPDGTAREFTFVMEAKSVITVPSGGQHLAGPGFREITGLAWSGRGRISPGRRLDRRRADLDRGDAAGAGAADRLDPVPPALDVGRPARPLAEPGHRRDRLRPADAGPAGRGAWSELLLPLQRDQDLGRRGQMGR